MADINSNLPVSDTADGTPGVVAPAIAQQMGGTDGTNLRVLSLDSTGKLNINNISGTISLPSGASTSALQTTGNSSLSSIDTKTPALGQTTMAGSSPVVIASNQSAIPVTQGTSPWVSSTKVSLTGSNPASANVGLTSGVVIASNANRKGLILTNTSSLATVSFHLNGGSAVLNSGITLYPHDSWVMDEFNFTTGAINGIASLINTPVGVQEFI